MWPLVYRTHNQKEAAVLPVKGIHETELVQLLTLMLGPPEEAMTMLQDCWETLVGNQSAAVNAITDCPPSFTCCLDPAAG
jgi:hypothetical protein